MKPIIVTLVVFASIFIFTTCIVCVSFWRSRWKRQYERIPLRKDLDLDEDWDI